MPVGKPAKNNPITLEGFQIPYYPVGDRIVAQRTGEDEVQTKSGIIVPPRDKDSLSFGVLIAAGAQAMDKLHSMGIAIGDHISWGKWAGIHWDWRIPGDKIAQASVDVLNVADILGSAELCDGIMNGKLAIDLHEEKDGVFKHRLFRLDESGDRQEGREGPQLDENGRGRPPADITLADVEARLKALKSELGIYHLRQNTAEMDKVQVQINELEKLRARARRGEAA